MTKSLITLPVALSMLYGAPANVLAMSWLCQKDNITREVIVDYPAAPSTLPCNVFYAKPDENAVPRALWRATNTEGFCQEKATAFVAKLESWGWQCMLDGQ
jgi:hypothetical protein